MKQTLALVLMVFGSFGAFAKESCPYNFTEIRKLNICVDDTPDTYGFNRGVVVTYSNSDAFIKHDANPPVQEYVKKHAELADGFTIEIYGNVSTNVIGTINRLGVPLKHFKTTRVGYVRDENFKEY